MDSTASPWIWGSWNYSLWLEAGVEDVFSILPPHEVFLLFHLDECRLPGLCWGPHYCLTLLTQLWISSSEERAHSLSWETVQVYSLLLRSPREDEPARYNQDQVAGQPVMGSPGLWHSQCLAAAAGSTCLFPGSRSCGRGGCHSDSRLSAEAPHTAGQGGQNLGTHTVVPLSPHSHCPQALLSWLPALGTLDSYTCYVSPAFSHFWSFSGLFLIPFSPPSPEPSSLLNSPLSSKHPSSLFHGSCVSSFSLCPGISLPFAPSVLWTLEGISALTLGYLTDQQQRMQNTCPLRIDIFACSPSKKLKTKFNGTSYLGLTLFFFKPLHIKANFLVVNYRLHQ